MKKIAAAMRALWLRDGSPSSRAIAARANGLISHTTVHNVIHGLKSPRWASIHTVAVALHAKEHELVTLRDLWDDEREADMKLRLPRVKTGTVIRPGDTIVFTLRDASQSTGAEELYRQLADMFPENTVTLLSGMEITAVSRQEAA